MSNTTNATRWKNLLRTASQVFGPRRVAIIGDAPGLAEVLVRVAGPLALAEPGVTAQAGILVAELSELAGLLKAHEPLEEMFAVVQAEAVEGERPLRTRVEQIFLDAGYIKSPATTALFDYAQLDANTTDCLALFAYRPLKLGPGETTERMKIERDLHADMLREAGVRSDAHVVRYQLAATLIKPGDQVLDAACGLGYGSHVLACQSGAAHVTGIDLSDWGVAHARRNYADERVTFECGSLPEALADVQASTYDFVVSLETLEHVEDPATLLQAFWRTLKPGGRIFVSVPNDWADESGKDPNPHHLHVYDWPRLRRELEGAQFIVEAAWSLTASGCKTGADRRWRPQARKLDEVPLQEASLVEGEWWLACAMKSPLVDVTTPYEETVHVGFHGQTSLVDFQQHYDNPRIVHAMVELPWRVRDKSALIDVAEKVVADAAEFSADRGAGLAVTGWRLLESEDLHGAMDIWLTQVDGYLVQAGRHANPHVRRWGVSLAYLQARIYEARGDAVAAQQAYSRVLDADVHTITPTLGTKQADAAVRAGMLAFRAGRRDEAIAVWRRGLKLAFGCLQADPIEFIGSLHDPFVFSMNDLVEIADGATRLANAIHAVAGRTHASAVPRQLGAVAQQSLRSAVSSLQQTVRQMSAESSAQTAALAVAQKSAMSRQEETAEWAEKLSLMEAAKSTAEQFAYERLAQIEAQRAQLHAMTQAKIEAEKLAWAATDKHAALDRRLEELEAAKAQAEQFAHERLAELETQQTQHGVMMQAKQEAERLVLVRSQESADLARQLEQTELAKARAEQLGRERLAELENQHAQHGLMVQAKQEAERLVLIRSQENADLARQLEQMALAKAQAEQLAHAHVAELEELQRRLVSTQGVREEAERYMKSYLGELQQARVELTGMEQAKAEAEQLAHTYAAELGELQRRLVSTEGVRQDAERYMRSYLGELQQARVELAGMEQAKANAEEWVRSGREEVGALRAQIQQIEAAKGAAEDALQTCSARLRVMQAELDRAAAEMALVTSRAILFDDAQRELAEIKSARSYRLLRFMRLVPTQEQ